MSRISTTVLPNDSASTGKAMKRYNMVLPEALFDELQKTADAHDTTVADLLRRFVKLGLITLKLNEDPNAALLIREGDVEREVLLL